MKINCKKIIKLFNKKLFFKIILKTYNIFLFYKYHFKCKIILKKINKLYKYKNISYLSNTKNKLSELCAKYGSDKGYFDINKKTPYNWKAHSYSNFYYNLFNHCKDKIELIFECGIGTNNENFISNMTLDGKPGASLRVWRDYFINSQVYGADIDKNILFKEDRIHTYYVDQTNQLSINKMWININKDNFDVIIDDGLHTLEGGLTLFENSFNKLKKNGIYIIEDVYPIYMNQLLNKLSDYNTELILFKDFYTRKKDSNLILIRKD
jgi:hypothetical protein